MAAPTLRTPSLRILGFGKVGQKAGIYARKAGVRVSAVADSSGVQDLGKPHGYEKLVEIKQTTGKLRDPAGPVSSIVSNERGCVLADCSASDSTWKTILEGSSRGMGIVLANKKVLTGAPEVFTELMQNRRVRFEATVGAGLPVILTARRMLACKDEINQVTGQLSGTLGYILSRLSQGGDVAFSQVVKEAMDKGYTEPDERDDLSGVDVGRKALILARYALGMPTARMEDLKIDALYPPEFAKLPLDEFRRRLPELDAGFKERIASAKSRSAVLRYAAQVSRDGLRVGLVEVPASSPLGALNGTNNLVSFRSRMYPEGQETVVIGPGAGVAVTAAAVCADAIELLQMKSSPRPASKTSSKATAATA